ncbi:hypothetical protein SAMN02745866_00198 [Alteromonadaceae bacterium Bs31]|nr:hypothetical protein SAMN02745866_00198 [Alteromonadaceae bacterium Bs31]
MKNRLCSRSLSLSVLVALIFSVSVSANESFYRYSDIEAWFSLNSQPLSEMVKRVGGEGLFSLQYQVGAGLSSSAGQGSPVSLYTGEHAEFYQSVLSEAPVSMLLNTGDFVLLEPGVFTCGIRQCSYSLENTETSVPTERCSASSLKAPRGHCMFTLKPGWRLNYYWIEKGEP